MNNINPLIAEIGINHNGDLNVAKNIDTAKNCNFDVVKFQKEILI